jgi:basic amino acid/polyamine antiporter, APA family
VNQPQSGQYLAQENSITSAAPKPALSFADAIAIIIGVVIGAGVYELPALVASKVANPSDLLLLWLAGGVFSLIGALCYAELGTTYPNVGGTYYYLKRAYGESLAFLFAWSRMTVIQTGSIALLAFIFGDYASQLLRLGAYSASIYAAFAIALLTLLNIAGLQQGKWVQNLLSLAKVMGVLLIVAIGLLFPANGAVTPPGVSQTAIGQVMVLVLLSYGGWNEAAYISAEIRNGERNLVRSLLWSIGIITAIYLLINWAYVRGLGLAGMTGSEAVAADLLRNSFGATGSTIISILVVITTLGSMNATIFTGARSNYALGQDSVLFRFLGQWQEQSGVPTTSFWVQGAIAILLVGLGTLTREGVQSMVDYTAPVFWFFFLLSGISLLILRWREPRLPRPFSVPLFPVIPLLFCSVCAYLLYSSVTYTGVGAFVGVIVVGLGAILLFWNRTR